MSYQRASTEVEVVEDDRDLVRAAKKDVEAFGKLYDRYYGEVSGYIYHRTLDRGLTEELTSNTFFSALKHLGRFRWRRIPFGAWLYRIATNEIRMHYRKSRRISQVSFQSEADAAVTSKIRSPELSASDTVIAAQQFETLHGAIDALKPDYQAVIVLRYFEEKTAREIGQIIGKREGTVRSMIHRGLKQLRWSISDHDMRELD